MLINGPPGGFNVSGLARLLAVIGIAMIAALFLDVTARAAVTGREIQEMRFGSIDVFVIIAIIVTIGLGYLIVLLLPKSRTLGTGRTPTHARTHAEPRENRPFASAGPDLDHATRAGTRVTSLLAV